VKFQHLGNLKYKMLNLSHKYSLLWWTSDYFLKSVYFGGFQLFIKPLSILLVPEIDMSVVDYRSCHSFITDGWCSTSLMFFTWGRVFDDIIAIRISVAGILRAAIRSM
jgi:hypothetical protein